MAAYRRSTPPARPRTQEQKLIVSTCLPPADVERIDRLAEARRITRSETLRLLIRERLAGPSPALATA
ncbi:Ribbon-helix-helix protein, copG family [Aquisphaera giovannonii]|uniref:Ribbon-helix-helix protein, copG family n=2 Tax=Aquisphaera giovannonii TaxID=406548 RepID=A0A5B9WBI6_9BACT|nr:Ribbon-helix-helix protein, copG family [Aquisphaera giovannonii]